VAWRAVVVANPAKLRLERDQLVISQDDVVTLPLEDISVLVVESPEVTLSSALLSRLAQQDVTLLVCDQRHLPSLVGLPCAPHSRVAGMQRTQLGTSLPFRKRCWQAVVKRKIMNQARCLEFLARPGAGQVAALAAAVASGDVRNTESLAARLYFREAFGSAFSRSADDEINGALDYGYAVVRAAIARAFCAHGFLLSQGIHHHSELNPFNLADDFLEPLRPLVDLSVATLMPTEGLTKKNRERLVGLLHADVLIDGNRQAVTRAAEIMAGSFVASCREGDPRLLLLTELVPLAAHAYE
jgi:CRISPR-associated protein Cas1